MAMPMECSEGDPRNMPGRFGAHGLERDIKRWNSVARRFDRAERRVRRAAEAFDHHLTDFTQNPMTERHSRVEIASDVAGLGVLAMRFAHVCVAEVPAMLHGAHFQNVTGLEPTLLNARLVLEGQGF